MLGLLLYLSCQLLAVLAVNPGLNQGTGSNYGETLYIYRTVPVLPAAGSANSLNLFTLSPHRVLYLLERSWIILYYIFVCLHITHITHTLSILPPASEERGGDGGGKGEELPLFLSFLYIILDSQS